MSRKPIVLWGKIHVFYENLVSLQIVMDLSTVQSVHIENKLFESFEKKNNKLYLALTAGKFWVGNLNFVEKSSTILSEISDQLLKFPIK